MKLMEDRSFEGWHKMLWCTPPALFFNALMFKSYFSILVPLDTIVNGNFKMFSAQKAIPITFSYHFSEVFIIDY